MTVAKQKVSAPIVASSYALGFIVLCLVIYILHVGATIMIPFVIALFLWYLINALARGLGRLFTKLPRFFCFFLAILSIIAGLWFTYKLVSANAAEVISAAPVYQQKLESFLPTLLDNIPAPYRPNMHDLTGFIDIAGSITALAKMFTGIAGKTLVVLFYTGFLLYEQQFFRRKLDAVIESAETERRVHGILRNIDIKIQRYIWVKTFISAMTGICTWLLLRFFHIDFAEFWGVMAFILNFIPYVGSLVAVIMPSVIALVQTGDVTTTTMVLAGLSVIQLLWGSVLDPRMMGDSLNLSPIFIIFSLAAWGMIWGVPGMFLSIPILAMITITLSQFPTTRPIAILLSKTGDVERDEGSKQLNNE